MYSRTSVTPSKYFQIGREDFGSRRGSRNAKNRSILCVGCEDFLREADDVVDQKAPHHLKRFTGGHTGRLQKKVNHLRSRSSLFFLNFLQIPNFARHVVGSGVYGGNSFSQSGSKKNEFCPMAPQRTVREAQMQESPRAPLGTHRPPQEKRRSGQATVEYIILLAVVASFFLVTRGFFENFKRTAFTEDSKAMKTYARVYKYGRGDARGYDESSEGIPENHPMIEDGAGATNGNFRIFIRVER